MHFKTLITVFLAVLPVVISTGSSSCSTNQFWYGQKGCCLDKGGPKAPPTPPKGTSCNTNNEYYHSEQKCCVPRCPSGWGYNSNQHKCQPPTPPSPPTGQPSGHPGNNNNGGNGHTNNYNHHKRAPKSRSEMCPTDTYACPVADVPGDFECLDTTRDLVSCGGCISEGKGQDCTTIQFADNVACESKSCRVYTCESGFKPSLDGKSCVAN